MLATHQQTRQKVYAFFVLLAFTIVTGFSQTPTFVDIDATGANDGTSWSDAYVDLKLALDNAMVDDSIWVAEGTYYPDPVSKDSVFNIGHRVSVFGGFDGSETTIDQRDIDGNSTILSGGIDGNAGLFDAGNSYTVVYFELDCDWARLDGFTVTMGSAFQPSPVTNLQVSGGAVYIEGGTNNGGIPFLINCTFVDNFADDFGGAIFLDGTSGGYAHGVFKDCVFDNNESDQKGGAIYHNGESSSLILNCVFNDNSSIEGGAIYNSGFNFESSPWIVNSIFVDNEATSPDPMSNEQGIGGAVFNFSKGANGISSPHFINCLIYDNTALSAGGIYSISTDGATSETEITNCTFHNNKATILGGHVYVNESFGSNTVTTIRNTIIEGSVTTNNGAYFGFSGSGDPIIDIDYSLVDAAECDDMMDGITGTITCGSNMLYNVAPLFIDESANNFMLNNSSVAVNFGDSTLLPLDHLDLNQNGDTLELLPVDLVWNMRIAGDNVDLGPFETSSTPARLGALPVELLSFNATPKSGRVSINWVTLSEDNNDYFTVERSVDGKTFEAIHREAGAGTTSLARTYQVFDNNPFTGKSYYRLKQTDLDGRFEYSDIRAVNILEEGQLLTYPNPVTNRLQVALSGFSVREVGFEIYHLSGKKMHSGTSEVNEGVVVIELAEVEKLLPGSYIIRIVNERGGDLYGKFLKVGL